MAQKNALVRKLPSVETLGCTTVILIQLQFLVEKMGRPSGLDSDSAAGDHMGCSRTWGKIQRRIATLEFDRDRKLMGVVVSSNSGKNSLLVKFLANKGFLVSISNDNEIQVWNLENRSIASSLQWSSNITSFSVIYGSFFMYVGDDNGLMFVLKHEDGGQLLLLPYHISAKSLTEAAESSCPDHQTVVGVLHQPSSSGNRVLVAYESGLIILWDIFEAQVVLVRGDKDLELKDGAVGQPEHNLEEREITALSWTSSKGTVVAAGYIDGDIMFWKTSTTESSKKTKAARKKQISAAISPAADIFLWKNKKVSAGVLGFATIIWVLFELVEYHLLTLVCHTLILSLAGLFLWSNSASFINKSAPRFPEVALLEDIVLAVASAFRTEINQALVILRNIASGKYLKKFLTVIAGLWALSILGSCWNFLTLLYTSFVLLHTVPYLYDRYEDKVDAFAEKEEAEIKKQYAVFNVKVLSKIPVGALKQKFA